jgi:hypothetical protein
VKGLRKSVANTKPDDHIEIGINVLVAEEALARLIREVFK